MFKRLFDSGKQYVAPPKLPTVAEIHETFLTEAERILEDAAIEEKVEYDQETYDASKIAMELGFSSSRAAQNAAEIDFAITKARQLNAKRKITAEACLYFKQKYPLYKFITLSSIERICEQYNLVYGTADSYIGDIPIKNLKEMKAFTIDKNDALYYYTDWDGRRDNVKEIDFDQVKRYHDDQKGHRTSEASFRIAAPEKDFNTGEYTREGHKIVRKPAPLDPVVFKPVIFKRKKFYLIVTAWGEEASDPDVLNEIKN